MNRTAIIDTQYAYIGVPDEPSSDEPDVFFKGNCSELRDLDANPTTLTIDGKNFALKSEELTHDVSVLLASIFNNHYSMSMRLH
jgi:hypothetical protein